MKAFIESIVRLLDWVSCIIPNMLMVDDAEPPTNPIKYGMSVFGGLLVCASGGFGAFIIVGSFVCAVASYPITSCSIALVLGLFIGLGYLRKKIGGKLG
jgi:hypothetical protein